jgi:hypothetical protein
MTMSLRGEKLWACSRLVLNFDSLFSQNRSKLNREDAEALKATEVCAYSGPLFIRSTLSFIVLPSSFPCIHCARDESCSNHTLSSPKPIPTIGVCILVPMSSCLCLIQKDVQPSLHLKTRSEDLRARNVPNELPVNTVLNSWSIAAQEAGRSQFPPGYGKGLKTVPNHSVESSREAQVPSMRPMDSVQRNDAHKGKRTTPDTATPAPINSTLATDLHPSQMQSEGKGPRIPPQVQNPSPPSPLLRSDTRPFITTDAPIGISTVLPASNSAAVSSTTPGMDPRAQASLSPPGLRTLNYQPTRNFSNNSTTVVVTSSTPNLPQVRPPSSYGIFLAVPTAPRSQNPSPRNTELAPLPVPSSETPSGHFSAPSVNTSPHIRVPQSRASIPTSAQTSSLAVNWDRNVAARQEVCQFAGPMADSPLLPKKDGIMVTLASSFFNKVLIFVFGTRLTSFKSQIMWCPPQSESPNVSRPEEKGTELILVINLIFLVII